MPGLYAAPLQIGFKAHHHLIGELVIIADLPARYGAAVAIRSDGVEEQTRLHARIEAIDNPAALAAVDADMEPGPIDFGLFEQKLEKPSLHSWL